MPTENEVVTMGNMTITPEEGEKPSQQQQQQQNQNEPAPVEVTIGGKAFKLSPDVAAALKAQQDASEQELAAARAASAPIEKSNEPAALDHSKLFVDPAGFINDLKKEIVTEVAGAYQRDKAEAFIWQTLYDRNPELKPYDHYIKSVVSRDMAVLRPMKVDAAIDRIADTVRAELLAMGNTKVKKPEKKGNVTEGGGERGTQNAPVESNAPESQQVPQGSITAVLMKRREARRAGGKSKSE